MQFTIEYDPIHEYRKLFFTLSKVQNGWFKQKGFLATHKPLKDLPDVVIPNWKLFNDVNFWRKIEQINQKSTSYLTLQIKDLPELYDIISKETEIDITEIRVLWKAIEKEFTQYFTKFLDHNSLINRVEVYLTRYGTRATYNHSDSVVKIYLREDIDYSEIAFCTLAGLFHAQNGVTDFNVNASKYNWAEKQNTIDYLMSQTALSDLFPNYTSLMYSLRNNGINPEYVISSNKIYNKLGFPVNLPLQIVQDVVVWEDDPLPIFSKNEVLVIDNLLKNKGRVVTYEDISEVLWGEESYASFSLEAISKVVERIRKKFIDCGIYRQFILTKRGLGYILVE